MVIAERDRGLVRLGARDAVHRRAVLQDMERAIFRQAHMVDPEEAARRRHGRTRRQELHEEEAGGDAEREPPAPLAELDQDQRCGCSRDEDEPGRWAAEQKQGQQRGQQQCRVEQVATADAVAVSAAGRTGCARRDKRQGVFPDIREYERRQQRVE